MNYSTGQGGQAIQNYSLVAHLVIGPTVTQVGGYQSTAVSLRTGQVALAGGTATVASPWAFPQSLIYLTVIGPSAAMGRPSSPRAPPGHSPSAPPAIPTPA